MPIRSITILLIVCCFIPTVFGLFCSSYCAGNRACWNSSTGGCMACSSSLFNQKTDSVTHECNLNNQTLVFALDLYGTFSLSGFVLTNSTPYSCSADYNLSGQYGKTDSIAKTYTNLPVNHFYTVVRFNIMFMGMWTSSEMIVATLDGAQSSWNYSCPSTTEALCTATDCMRAYQMEGNHTNTNLTVMIKSIMLGAPPTQAWGVKDLVVGLKMCHPSCMTCYGAKSSECYSCQVGFYLTGNTCVDKCPFFVISSSQYCIEACPSVYYQFGTVCELCHSKCSTCKGPADTDCITRYDGQSGWEDNKEMWIVLIILALIIVGCLIYFLVKHYRNKSIIQSNSSMKEKILMSELNVGQDGGGNQPPRLRELNLKPFEIKKASSGSMIKNQSTLMINQKEKQLKQMRDVHSDLQAIDI